MELTKELKSSLKREYDLCSNAVAFYRKTVKKFEKRYNLTTIAFLKKFDSGILGDESDYFDWYAYAKLLQEWQDTLTALRSASN